MQHCYKVAFETWYGIIIHALLENFILLRIATVARFWNNHRNLRKFTTCFTRHAMACSLLLVPLIVFTYILSPHTKSCMCMDVCITIHLCHIIPYHVGHCQRQWPVPRQWQLPVFWWSFTSCWWSHCFTHSGNWSYCKLSFNDQNPPAVPVPTNVWAQ